MPFISVDELIASGIHFGHSISHWNPKMEKYIFGKKNRVYIINLKETIRGLLRAWYFVRYVISKGGKILLVGTKKQAKDKIREIGQKYDMPYVANKWLGGTLTNLPVIRKSIEKLKKLEELEREGIIQTYSKKELARHNREKAKLQRNVEGIVNMEELPDAVVVIDVNYERITILEAKKMKIPIIALADTNVDPEGIDFVIPGNDDSIRAINLVLDKLAQAIEEGIKLREKIIIKENKKVAEESSQKESSSDVEVQK